jgi:phage recombination protein Bet
MTETTITTTTADNSLTQGERQAMTYTPLGENTPITLTLQMIAHDIATPTKKGAVPSEGDCLRFMNLCRGRELNPWTGDCFMIGFDSNNGPSFELITSYQALLKRAERSPNFDGLEGGVVVQVGDALEQREGSLVSKGETVVGGWAKAWRTDRRIAHTAIVDLKTYSTGRSRWGVDPAGMIQKVAKAAALREAFPNTVGGLYVQEEMEHVRAEAEVITPARIAAPDKCPPIENGQFKRDEPEQTKAEPHLHADRPLLPGSGEKKAEKKAKPNAKTKATKANPPAVDWVAEFTLYGVTDQAVLLRDSPTAADRESVMSAAKSMVADGEMKQTAFDCLGRYLAELESRRGVTA